MIILVSGFMNQRVTRLLSNHMYSYSLITILLADIMFILFVITMNVAIHNEISIAYCIISNCCHFIKAVSHFGLCITVIFVPLFGFVLCLRKTPLNSGKITCITFLCLARPITERLCPNIFNLLCLYRWWTRNVGS